MKTLELELKKKVLIVDINHFNRDGKLQLQEILNNCPDGYELLCDGSELTEEIASELVNSDDEYGVVMYQNYRTTSMCYFDEQINALESFISAVESKGFHWLKHNVRKFSLYDPRSKTGCHDLEEEDIVTKQWQEAEEKTFKNPLIFVKK